MAERGVGAAVVHRSRRDGAGHHHRARHPALARRGARTRTRAGRRPPDLRARVRAPDWSLEQAAVAMVSGGFRHLVVIEAGETAGILSVRDIVRCWTDDGASCEMPQSASLASWRAAGEARSSSGGVPGKRRRGQEDPRRTSARLSGRAELFHLPPRRRDPDRAVPRNSSRPRRSEDRRDRDADDRDREAGRVEDRQDARRRHVDLLAGRRGQMMSSGSVITACRSAPRPRSSRT